MYEWKTCHYWSLIFSFVIWPNLNNRAADLVDFFTNIGDLPVPNIGHQCQDTTDEWLAVSICNSAVCSQESCIHMCWFPLMVVPPKHPKMIICSRKTNGCWVPPFKKTPMYTRPLWGYPLYLLILVSLPWPDIVYLYTELGKQKSWESSPLSFLSNDGYSGQ